VYRVVRESRGKASILLQQRTTHSIAIWYSYLQNSTLKLLFSPQTKKNKYEKMSTNVKECNQAAYIKTCSLQNSICSQQVLFLRT
jgi:ERCC4-related helicase